MLTQLKILCCLRQIKPLLCLYRSWYYPRINFRSKMILQIFVFFLLEKKTIAVHHLYFSIYAFMKFRYFWNQDLNFLWSNSNSKLLSRMETVRRLGSEKPVVIFSKGNCCISQAIKMLIRSIGANPAVCELDHHPKGRDIENALLTLGCNPSVPAVFIGKLFVGGSTEVLSLNIRGKLKPLLIEANAIWMWLYLRHHLHISASVSFLILFPFSSPFAIFRWEGFCHEDTAVALSQRFDQLWVSFSCVIISS